jgi:hypothetical protein
MIIQEPSGPVSVILCSVVNNVSDDNFCGIFPQEHLLTTMTPTMKAAPKSRGANPSLRLPLPT